MGAWSQCAGSDMDMHDIVRDKSTVVSPYFNVTSVCFDARSVMDKVL